MALALELSRREESGQPSRQPQQPRLHHSHNNPTNPALRSFSAAPFYHRPNASEDEEDEDLQMALAYSLSEMEAQQRTEDMISGAGGGRGTQPRAGGVGNRRDAPQKTKSESQKTDNSTGSTSPSLDDRETGPVHGSENMHQENVVVKEKENVKSMANGTNAVKKRRKCQCVVC